MSVAFLIEVWCHDRLLGCCDIRSPDGSRFLQWTDTGFYFSPVPPAPTLSHVHISHTHILFPWPFSIYSLTTYAHASYFAPLHVYHLLDATGVKSQSWCDVNGKMKGIKAPLLIGRTAASSPALSLSVRPNLPTKANILRAPNTHNHRLIQTDWGARAGMSPARKSSLRVFCSYEITLETHTAG